MHTKGKLTITSVEGGWDGIKCIDDNGQSTLIYKMSTTNPDDIVRICCCVNSHDALLEACKDALSYINEVLCSELKNFGSNCQSDIELKQTLEAVIAKAAIAQAEKP